MNRSNILSLTIFVFGVVAVGSNASAQSDCEPDPFLFAEDIVVACEDLFEEAQTAIRNAFEKINAYDSGCDMDLTPMIRVENINWVKPNGKYMVSLPLLEIASKLEAFDEDEYDYTVGKTQKLFHYHFLFRPGIYEVYYHIIGADEQPIDAFRARRKQIITISSECNGCLGMLSCNSCAGCRAKYIPEAITELELKRLLGDWLLIGLSVLIMLSWNTVFRG